MADLVVIVPSRGRPQAVLGMAEAFRQTCTAATDLLWAVDDDDACLEQYTAAVSAFAYGPAALPMRVGVADAPSTMVGTLNTAARMVVADEPAKAIAFMGDDHRPRTKGWDTAYLEALERLPGFVYGNDLIQGANLPTQVAMSAEVVRALGHMAPPTLTHLYVDNYWLSLGRATGCITYLPDVVVEHRHPVAGKAEWDAGYQRVNDPAMYDRDAAAFAAYWREHGDRDVRAVREAVAKVAP